MIETVLTAGALGLLAGAIPGPYTTVVAGTAVEKGLRPALRLAFVPLVTDVPPMLVTAFALDRMNATLLTGVGILGGLLLGWIGVRFLRRNAEGWGEPHGSENEQSARFGHLAVAGLLSPAPWFFWLVAASPLLLRAWGEGAAQGVVFAVVLFAVLIATAAGIAWLACRGGMRLDRAWRQRLLRVVGMGMIAAGGLLVWQSAEGNFQSMVQRQQELREVVD